MMTLSNEIDVSILYVLKCVKYCLLCYCVEHIITDKNLKRMVSFKLVFFFPSLLYRRCYEKKVKISTTSNDSFVSLCLQHAVVRVVEEVSFEDSQFQWRQNVASVPEYCQNSHTKNIREYCDLNTTKYYYYYSSDAKFASNFSIIRRIKNRSFQRVSGPPVINHINSNHYHQQSLQLWLLSCSCECVSVICVSQCVIVVIFRTNHTLNMQYTHSNEGWH